MSNALRQVFGANLRTLHVQQHRPRRQLNKGEPGSRTCPDCGESFWNDNSGIAYCCTCRPRHDRICIDCGVRFDGDVSGNRRCKSCQNQIALF